MRNHPIGPKFRASLQFALMLLTLVATSMPTSTGRAQDGLRFTPTSELPERFHDVLACAEEGHAWCENYLGDIWDGNYESGVWNAHEAERWWLKAAMQGYRPAMRHYSVGLCMDNEFILHEDGGVNLTPKAPKIAESEKIEGLAWRLLASEYSLGDLDIDLCTAQFPKTISLEKRHDLIDRAIKRAKKLENNIGAIGG